MTDSTDEAAVTILIADDFEEIRAILRMWLERRGYQVLEATDGEKAIEMAGSQRPDLILMDIAMPHRSGISAAYRIRKQAELRDIPIVAMTAYDTAELHDDAFDAGCNEYLTKPIDKEKLENVLTRFLPR